MNIYTSASWKLIKLLLQSKLRGKAVRLQAIYSLALAEMTTALGKMAPNTTVTGEIESVRRRLADASAILATPTVSEFNIENPIQTIRLLAFSLETGIDRKLSGPARTLQLIEQILTDTTFTKEQKEKFLQLAAETYLVGLLAPLTQLDLFSQKLDELLLQTRCATREELMKELREKHSIDEVLKKLEEHQKADIQTVKHKCPLTLAERVAIINSIFRRLSDVNVKHSFTSRTIQNWDNGKCPYEGYSNLFNEIELISWANKIVGEIRSKQALRNIIPGLSDEEISRRAKKP